MTGFLTTRFKNESVLGAYYKMARCRMMLRRSDCTISIWLMIAKQNKANCLIVFDLVLSLEIHVNILYRINKTATCSFAQYKPNCAFQPVHPRSMLFAA